MINENITEGFKVLLVAYMQNDFITGPLGTDETAALVPKVIDKIKQQHKQYGSSFLPIAITDGHIQDESNNLLTSHCIIGDDGYLIQSDVYKVLLEHRNPNQPHLIMRSSGENFRIQDLVECLVSNIRTIYDHELKLYDSPVSEQDFTDHEILNMIERVELVGLFFDLDRMTSLIRSAFSEDRFKLDNAYCCEIHNIPPSV